jgi:hypothetical protein
LQTPYSQPVDWIDMSRPQTSPAPPFGEAARHEPWEVFARTFHDTVSAADPSADPAALLAGADAARRTAVGHMLDVLLWPAEEAARISRLMQVELAVWAHRGGCGEANLHLRLQRVQAKVRAEVALGISSWPVAEAVERDVPAGAAIRTVRLTASFYLPRVSASGEEVRDVVPWEGAREYVTDGSRYGVRMQDESVRWFESAASELVASLREDFGGVDVAGVLDGLKEYAARTDRVSLSLAADIGLMEALLGR